MKFLAKLSNMFKRAAKKIAHIVKLTFQNIKNTIKNIWRNAESVAILTIGSLGASHFIGSYVFAHEGLNSLFFAEMIGPVLAIGLIWGLVRLAEFRRNRRMRPMTTRAAF